MRKRNLKITAAVGVSAAAVAILPMATASAETVTTIEARGPGALTVPAALVPPAGNKLTSIFGATGVQIYGCTAGAWTLTEPAATLVGAAVGSIKPLTALHFRGPSWQSPQDGSLVEGMSPVSAPSTTPNSIPQLLVTAKTSRGPGVFGGVSFIQRLATSGGVAPARACVAGETTAVSYKAVYRFFKPVA